MVKYALISDIHGNYKALEAFLTYIEENPVDGIIALGDYVTDGPYPERTIKYLQEMCEKYTCYFLRGNREEYLLNNTDNKEGWKPSSANGTLYYTFRRLTEADRAFLASFPTEREAAMEGCLPLYLCHGVPGKVRGNVQEEPGLKERVMRELPYDYLLGGHSHHQEKDVLYGKIYINPGSLGFAVDNVGRHAQFAILTGSQDRWEAEFKSVSYDVEGYLRAFAESGVDELGMTLNKAVKKSLVTGVNYFYKCIVAMDEEAKKAGAQSLGEMPEEAWRRLEERFGL